MRRPGVRLRVAGAFALAMAVLLTVAGFAIRAGLRDEITGATDETLETRATAVARLLVDRGRPLPGLTDGLDDPGETFTQVIGPGGEVVISSPGLPRGPLLDAARRDEATEGMTIRLPVPVEPDEGDEDVDRDALEETVEEPFESDRARVIARTVEAGGTTYAVITGATLEDREDAVRALDRVLLIALPLSLLGATLAGWFALVAALRPVERMRRRAARISDRSFSERLPVPGTNDEIARLGHTLNEMLDRLERALEAERAFAADASHELRTPLAVLRGELELALRRERPPEELRAALEAALAETLRLSALADDLLLMARSDAGQLELRREWIDAQEELEAVAARLGPLAGDRPLAVEAAPGFRFSGDAARIGQAVGNLVENALRHGAGPVVLGSAQENGTVALTVADRGPGVDPAFAQRAFERFSRP
ncbi:MAG: histidine kinase dimerization/phospho-acceptor domain-containing protein, partial [Solirubrobacteraceae bacterium]